MKAIFFKTPVSVLVGLGLPAKINTVMEAYQLLADWPVTAGDCTHSFALNACRAALEGEIEAETARGLFVAFAKNHDFLVPDMRLELLTQKGNRNPHVM
jgi:hypothetical protein